MKALYEGDKSRETPIGQRRQGRNYAFSFINTFYKKNLVIAFSTNLSIWG